VIWVETAAPLRVRTGDDSAVSLRVRATMKPSYDPDLETPAQ